MANKTQYVDGQVDLFKPCQFYIEVGQHADLKTQAAVEGRPMIALVRDAIDAYLFRVNHYVEQIVLSGEEQAKLRGLASRLNVSNPNAAAEKLLRYVLQDEEEIDAIAAASGGTVVGGDPGEETPDVLWGGGGR